MKRGILAIAAASAIFASPVLAQSTTPSAPATGSMPSSTTAPSTTTPSANMPSTTAPASGTSAASAPAGGYVSEQMAAQWLASDLIGTRVNGSGNENIGEINDVLIERNGSVVAVVIGVGGFLGIGEKDVAVPFASVEMVRNNNADTLVLRRTRDDLQNAPTFKAYEAPTTGSVGSTTTAPATTAPATTAPAR